MLEFSIQLMVSVLNNEMMCCCFTVLNSSDSVFALRKDMMWCVLQSNDGVCVT